VVGDEGVGWGSRVGGRRFMEAGGSVMEGLVEKMRVVDRGEIRYDVEELFRVAS
jgi:hypothetical protein